MSDARPVGQAAVPRAAMPILFCTILLDLIGFGIVIPILPFMSPALGASKMDVALIIVTFAACSGVCGPFWGKLSDRIGRRKVIVICLAGGALSYVFLALASALWMIYAARGLAGLMAGNIGVASAMVADLTTPANRAKGMGMIGVAFGAGLVIGPMLGGVLAGSTGDFFWPCVAAGAMSVMAIIAAWLFLPESLSVEHQAENRAAQRSADRLSTLGMLRSTRNRLLVSQFAVHSATISATTYIFPLWVADRLAWGPHQVGLVFGAQGLLIMALQGGLVGFLAPRVGEMRLLRGAIVLMLAGLTIALFAEGPVLMVAAFIVAASGSTMCPPVLNSVTSLRTPRELRGRMLGTASSAASWGRVIGPAFAGVNLTWLGYDGAWLGTAAIALVLLTWSLSQRSAGFAHGRE